MLFFLGCHGNDFGRGLFCSRLNGLEVFTVFWIHSQKQSPQDQEGSASWPVIPISPCVLWRDRVIFLCKFIVSKTERKDPGVLVLFCAEIPWGRGWARPGLATAWSSLPGQGGNGDGWIHSRHSHGDDDDEKPVPYVGHGWRRAGAEAL